MRRVLHASPLSLAVALVVAAASVVGFFFFQHGNDQQERTLLESDTNQAAAYVGSLFTGQIGALLEPVAAAVTLAHGSPAAFQAAAAPVVKQGQELGFAMTSRQGSSYVVTSAVGSVYSVGQTLDNDTSAILARAGATTLAGPVEFNGKTSTAFFAVGPPLVPAGTAIVFAFSLNPFVKSPVTAAKPFALLKVALYGTAKPSMSTLLVATVPSKELPLGPGSLTAQANVDGSNWALVAKAAVPLTGSFARNAPYVILGLGLFVALLVGVTLEVFDRRRRYAAALVAERTADLEQALVELRDAQEALIRGERLTALGEMASVVGHELRNPLAAVINALYLLRRQLGEPAQPALEKNLAMAERETTKAATLAEDLTAFVRTREPNMESVDVGALVNEVVQASPPPPQVTVDLDLEQTSVVADRNQLAEVLTNLLTNAYQAVNGEGTVRIAARDGSGETQLSVEDSGPGVDSAVAPKVFEPFFTTRHDGTGLGLAIVQRLVEAHGGTVGFDGAASIGGARVVVRLPAHDENVTS